MSSSGFEEGRLWRGVTRSAMVAGYAWGLVRKAIASRPVLRKVAVGPLSFQLPRQWGDFTSSPEGDVFVSSRPLEQVLDGDTNWYSTISEIRVRKPGVRPLAAMAPMQEIERVIETQYGPISIVLRIANGVGVRKRAEALRVLERIRVTNASPMVWPSP